MDVYYFDYFHGRRQEILVLCQCGALRWVLFRRRTIKRRQLVWSKGHGGWRWDFLGLPDIPYTLVLERFSCHGDYAVHHVLEFLGDGRRFTNDWATELRAVIYKKTFKVEVDSSSSLNDLSELAKGLVEKGVYEKDAQAELPQRWVQEKEEAWIQLNSVCLVG